MAHAAVPPPGRKLRLRLLGVGVIVLGIALLTVTIVSLNRPGQKQVGGSTPSASTSSSGPVVGGSPSAASPTTTPTPTPTPTTAVPTTPVPTTPKPKPTAPAVAKVAVAVANNTGQPGLADTAASRFESAGWTVSDISNFTGDIISTCAYYDPANPADEPAALLLQKEFPAIKRVKPRFDGLPDAPIVVVLTTDYS